MSTTKTTPPASPESPATLPTFEDLLSELKERTTPFDDGSVIVDKTAYLAAVSQMAEQMVENARGHGIVGESSRLGALANLAIRAACTREVKGASITDWAGLGTAYKTTNDKMLDTYGREHNLTETQVKKYRSNIGSYISDHQLLDRQLAEHRAATTDTKVTVAEVRAAFDAPAGTTIPGPIRQLAEKERRTQVNNSGKVLSNFDPANVARVSGRKPKKGQTRTADENASSETPGKAWGDCRKAVSMKEGGLTLPIAADEVLHLIDAALIPRFTGEDLTGRNPKVEPGSKDAVETYRQAYNLIGSFLAWKDGKGEKSAMLEHRWTENDK